MIGNAGIADRAEKDGGERGELIDAVFRHHAPGLGVGFARPVEFAPFERNTELAADFLQHGHRFGQYFLADAVTRNKRDLVTCHGGLPY